MVIAASDREQSLAANGDQRVPERDYSVPGGDSVRDVAERKAA